MSVLVYLTALIAGGGAVVLDSIPLAMLSCTLIIVQTIDDKDFRATLQVKADKVVVIDKEAAE